MTTRHELGSGGERNNARDYAHVSADQHNDHNTSLARDARGFKTHVQRRVDNIYYMFQTSLGVMERRFNARARARRLGSEEMEPRGEWSRIDV